MSIIDFKEIPKFDWNSNEAKACYQLNVPFILINCPLVESAVNRWNFEFLSNIVADDFLCDVYGVDKNTTHEYPIFHYWDTSKNVNGYKFSPPTTKFTMSFKEFFRQSSSEDFSHYLYLQQRIVAEMGQEITEEFMQFSLETALNVKQLGNWNELTTNLLLCGPPRAITSCHFDEQQNLFAQLSGRKRVRLYSPSDWPKLYPYPLGHPRDRQSQILLPMDTTTTNTITEQNRSFPLYAQATEYRVDLNPGDILYVPQYWWHQMEALTQNVSIAWWFKCSNNKENVSGILDRSAPLPTEIKIALRRNIERIVGDAAGGGRQAHNFFLAIAGGRLQLPADEDSSPPPQLLESDIAASSNIVILPAWNDVITYAYTLLGHILPTSEIPYFLIELAAGRFANAGEI